MPRLGGLFYGWWLVFISATIIVVAAGPFFYGFSVLVEPLLQEFGWSTLATAAAFSLRSEASAVAAPLTGVLIDRFGPRHVMIAGVITVALGFLWLSQAADLSTFYGAVVLISIGTTFCASQPAAIVISRWFYRLRSRALTFVTVGGALSGLTVPFLALAVARFGWRGALVVWAAVVLAVCFPLALLVKPNPEAAGLRPDGDPPGPGPLDASPAAAGERNPGPERGAAELTPAGMAAGSRGAGLTLKEALRTKAFWLLALAFAFSNFGTTPAFGLLVPALTRSGISTELAAVAAAAIPLASLPGRMAIGFGGDYVDKRKLVALCLGLQAAGLMLLAGAGSVALLAIFVMVFGTGFGGPIPLRTAIQAELFGLTSLGSIQGMVTLGTTLGGLFGPIVAGGLVDVTGNYQAAFFVCAAMAALGIPLVLAVPRPGAVGPEVWREAAVSR